MKRTCTISKKMKALNNADLIKKYFTALTEMTSDTNELS